MNDIIVHCKSKEEFDLINKSAKKQRLNDICYDEYKEEICIRISYSILSYTKVESLSYCNLSYYKNNGQKTITFEEWCILTNNYINNKNKNESMQEMMLDVLNKTYDNLKLRRRTVPLFMSNPGIGKI